MSRSVIAVYSGTFDPLTLGHEDVVRRSAQLFDQVVIAVAVAHHKKTLFSLDERLAMAQAGLSASPSSRTPFMWLMACGVERVCAMPWPAISTISTGTCSPWRVTYFV